MIYYVQRKKKLMLESEDRDCGIIKRPFDTLYNEMAPITRPIVV